MERCVSTKYSPPGRVIVVLKEGCRDESTGLYKMNYMDREVLTPHKEVQFQLLSPFDISVLWNYYLNPLQIKSVKINLEMDYE